MSGQVETVAGRQVFRVALEGPALSSEQDAVDLIGATFGLDIDLLAIPAARFAPSFFDLSTRQAGLFIQKFSNYRLPLAIVGDLSAETAASGALAAFVTESNRRSGVMFAPAWADLEARLAAL
jgi:hypothetical protein